MDKANKRKVGLWLALLVLVVFLWPYLGIIAMSALLAFLMLPVYNWLRRRRGLSDNTSATLSLIASILLITIPAILIVWAGVNQGQQLVSDLQINDANVGEIDTGSIVYETVEQINNFADDFVGIENAISQEDVQGFIQTSIPKIANGLVNLSLSIVQGIPNFVIAAILFMYMFTAMLLYRKQLLRLIDTASPFGKKITHDMVNKVESMAKGMVIGQGVIAICQGFVASLSLIAIGLGNYFVVFFIFLSFMSLIPLGAGIITIPLGILAIVTGNVSGGMIVIATHLLVVTNIDNVLRPMLVPKEAKMPAALVMLSAFAGVYYFGFLGVVYGPVLMILMLSVLDAYSKNNAAKA